MKRVDAIVLPDQLEIVLQSLKDRKIDDYIVSEVVGFDHAHGHTECYRGAEYRVDVRPEAKLEVVVPDEIALATAYAMINATAAARIGAPRIFITPVDEVVRVPLAEAAIASGECAAAS
ncbi:MAG TPA: P-II family nitrogen regulator [Candidatus Binatia bacterium]|nr:P-II family nitrogen regulator [Candidatus Binatia bacterium]